MATPGSTPRRPMPDWATGVVAFAANWEPISFRRRQGATTVDDEKRYEYAHSEEMAKRLAASGINAVVWHGYKGLGLEFEKEEIEWTRRFGEHCRKHGLVLGTYCNIGSFFAETFFKHMPEARNWLTKDIHGLPYQYSEFYRCYYRYRPCMTHEAYFDYVQRMALYLVRNAGSQWILFDNNAMMPCYCDNCKKKFPEFLKKRYPIDTEEGRRRARQRFGYVELDSITLPRGTARMPIDTLPACHEPVLQEWVAYRCSLVTDGFTRVSKAIEQENPKVAVSLNPSMDLGEFTPLVWGNEYEDFQAGADFMFSEDDNCPRVGDRGQLIGHFVTFKYGRATGQRILEHQFDSADIRLTLMEAAVLNQGFLGNVGWAEQIPGPDSDLARTIAFVRRHAEMFTRNDTLADVAVLRGREAMVNNWADAFQSYLMVHQALYRYGIQYDVVLQRHLDSLDKYRLLILPNTISLPDECIEQIRKYILAGGAVLGIENAAACDGWGRSRTVASVGLDGERDSSLGTFSAAAGTGYLAKVLGVDGPAAARVYELPELPNKHRFQWQVDRAWVPVIDNQYWLLPENADELLRLIRTALQDRLLLCYERPQYVGAQLLTFGEKTALHLLNYDVGRTARERLLRLRLPVKKAVSFTMDDEVERELALERDNDVTTISVPSFDVYRAIILEQ